VTLTVDEKQAFKIAWYIHAHRCQFSIRRQWPRLERVRPLLNGLFISTMSVYGEDIASWF
jgi:hypothetical protein